MRHSPLTKRLSWPLNSALSYGCSGDRQLPHPFAKFRFLTCDQDFPLPPGESGCKTGEGGVDAVVGTRFCGAKQRGPPLADARPSRREGEAALAEREDASQLRCELPHSYSPKSTVTFVIGGRSDGGRKGLQSKPRPNSLKRSLMRRRSHCAA